MLRQTVGGRKEGLWDSSLASRVPGQGPQHPFLLPGWVDYLYRLGKQ